MPPPRSLLDHLRAEGYHPRSDKHSNALGEAIVEDLLATSPIMRERAARGELVYELNFDLLYGTANWNVDLVLGTPPRSGDSPLFTDTIRRTPPASVQIAIEFKAVMTEHRKTVKNRKRDLEAHHSHVHAYDPNAIAAGVLLVNAAPRFRSPLRGETTVHRNVNDLLAHCMSEAQAVSVRGGATGVGLDAKCVIVVAMDNEDLASTRFVEGPPAPAVGNPLEYDSFIQRVCSDYRTRFGQG